MLRYGAIDARTVRLWDVTDPRHPATAAVLTGHTDGVYAAAFSPDGRTLATAGDDHTIRLWDLTELHHPTALATLTGHTDRIHKVAFGPDGHTLASTSRDKTFRLWETDLARAATRICHAVQPAITRTEWAQCLPDLPYHPPCPPSR